MKEASETASDKVVARRQAEELTSPSAAHSANAAISMRQVYIGVFLTSVAVLLLEISLTRIFSYTLWHIFTYMTISLAMLGIGASGAVLASFTRLATLDLRLAHWSSLCAAISVPSMLFAINKTPFSPFGLVSRFSHIANFTIYCAAVTLVFFFGGLTIACAFRSVPQQASKIYFWDLAGAGTACLVVVAAIEAVGVPAVSALSTCLFLLAAAVFSPRGRVLRALTLVVIAVALIPAGLNIEKAIEFKANAGKIMSRTPNKEMTYSKWSPIFRVDAYNVPRLSSWRGALFGISAEDLSPDRKYAFIMHEGFAGTILIENDWDLSNMKVFDKSILKPPYLLKNHPDVLIIGPGGGVDVAMALKNEARSIRAVELDPLTVDLVRDQYADFVGNLYQRPNVSVVVDEGRSYLRRTDEKFDIIQTTGVDTAAAQNAAAFVMFENYLYTVEAHEDFLNRLNPDGMLSAVTFDGHYKSVTPRRVVRRVALMLAALENRGIENAQDHMAVIASSQGAQKLPYVIMLAKLSPFTDSEIENLRSFAEHLSFDPWHLPGRPADNPVAQIIVSTREERRDYFQKHPLNLAPPTDDNPFFFQFVKWTTLLRGERPLGPHGNPMGIGKLVLTITLGLSIVFGVGLIIWPLLMFQKDGLQTRFKWHFVVYFAALGLGFIFIEISYIQRFILFLGYPTYSLTVILFSVLTFSGIGSYLSGRLPLPPEKIIGYAVVLLSIVALGYMALLPPVFDFFLSYSRPWRIAVSLVLLLPLGLLLGTFFPTGLKIISEEDSRFVPWAWGINGCASVIGTILTLIVAMTYGFTTVTIAAVVIYLIGAAAIFRAAKIRGASA